MELSPEERRRIYEEEKAKLKSQGEAKKKPSAAKIGCFGCLGLIGLVVIMAVIGRYAPTEDRTGKLPSPSTYRAEGKILLTIKKTEYEYGYFKVWGIAENVGDKAVFSPTITLTVYSSDGNTVLAKSLSWPAGTYLHSMEPYQRAAFQDMTLVPGEPDYYRYELSVEGCSYDVKYPGKHK